MAFVKGFHKLSDVLDTICSYIIVVMLGAMVVITGAQIKMSILLSHLLVAALQRSLPRLSPSMVP